MCEIVMTGNNKWNTESLIKSGRCVECENVEERISNVCPCGNEINNNLGYYRSYGNYCRACIQKVNDKFKK